MVKAKKTVNYSKAWYALAVTRMMLGFIFLWAFLDKLMGLGFATQKGQAWLDGVSPTTGFLNFVAGKGANADFFTPLAGQPWVDWLFMLGLLGLGLSLMLGIGLRIAAVAGTAILLMMWLAEMPMKNNPILDDHVIYAAVLWVIALAPRKWSLTEQWLKTPTVKKNQWLW